MINELTYSTKDLPRVSLSDLHSGLSVAVDDCQLKPQVICKHSRERAALVSIGFLNNALEAIAVINELTAPDVIKIEDLSDEIKKDIIAGGPSESEIADNKWADGRDTLP